MKLDDYIGKLREVGTAMWPGTEREVGILLLSCADVQAAAFAARDHFKRQVQPVDGPMADSFQWEWEYQLVYRMLLDPDSKRPEDRLFATAGQLRERLTPDQVQYFLDEHAKLRLQHAKRLGLTDDQSDG